MGIKSIINTDRLYWLGRYSERVYSTLRLFCSYYDDLIEPEKTDYKKFCVSLEIPDIYKNKEDFLQTYAFSLEDPNSIISNLRRAYDNAIELREEIGSECLSYIQLAIYKMEEAQRSESPVLFFQEVIDHILAFWGCTDDQIDDENTRNIIKVGKRVERLDLYARTRMNDDDIRREVARLTGRIDRTDLSYRAELLYMLNHEAKQPEPDYDSIVAMVEQLVET